MLPPLTNNGDKIENEEPNLVDMFHGYDWSKTSLGPMDSWEPVFKATVNFCLHSAFPIVIYAGPDWTLIYNEAWRSILMTNNQHAFGKPAVQVCPELYNNVLKPKLENIRINGEGIIENDKYFEFKRNGCVEEAYFNYSLSPLFKSDGSFCGVINTMCDVTQKVLNLQRLKTLEEIRCRTSEFLSIEINRLDARYYETNVAKFTRELAVNFENLAKILRIDYKIDIPDPTEFDQIVGDKVYLDRDMYKAIMFNLFSNALKRTCLNGYISIRLYLDVKDEKKMIVLEVSDSGIDIPEIDLSNISQRFSYTKSQCSRNYVGLYLVKMLVTRHGGDITMTSVTNQGTTFKCWFPIGYRHLPINQIYNNFDENLINQDQRLHSNRQLDSENNDMIIGDYNMDTDNPDNNTDKMSTDDTISINIPAITTKKKYQILLVNDNTDIREDLSSEFDVHHVCSGHAIQKLKNINKLPDLILIDINVNEYNLLETLKSNGKTQLIPVILLSTKDVEISSIKGSDKIDDHLIKPFCIRELIARIHSNIKLSRLRHKLLIQRRNDEANRLLLSISSKILSRVDLKEILSYIVKEIHSLLPCKRISIISCELSDYISHTIYEDSSNVTSITEPLQLIEIDDNSKSPTSINSQEFLNNNFRVDIFNDIYCDDISETVSMLSVEIRVNDDRWGWIKAYRSPNSIWLNSEIELFQEISNQINLASIYSKLYEESLEQDVQIKDAEKANRDKGERLAHTSHELRNPLGAIVGILSSLESTGLDDGDQRDMINIMARASDIVLSIVNDILDAARLEAQKITLINRTFNLLKLLSDTIEQFGERAGNQQIELILSCEVDDLPRYVKSDPDRLGQVLHHLLSNSIKFTEKGEIVMNVTMQSKEVVDEDEESSTCGEIVKKDYLLIEISDTGIGIDPEFIEHIWESFTKGDTSITRRQDGTGLGLSICKKLVAINGGEIKVESQLGKGSKFWLTWNIELLESLSKYPNISCLGTLFDEEISYLLPQSIRSKRILIIHPVENARNAIVKYLQSIEIVDAFDTFDKAIQKVKGHVESYKQFGYDIIFISLYENNEEEIIKSVSELRKTEMNCNNSLSSLILFIVFPGDKRRSLIERVIKNVEGRSKVIYTPITWQKIISQFSHIEDDVCCFSISKKNTNMFESNSKK
ncbi:histidine kinase-like ATPase [Gigaspora rosea]|uniref:Histidine kinase-like ATPase n=1 Tax=Gigaspora rosea TaxID=44941 RepID=A0A397V7N9_9GLOM|nr:histidine kinase-like ATPase [Gigaspora rosea]